MSLSDDTRKQEERLGGQEGEENWAVLHPDWTAQIIVWVIIPRRERSTELCPRERSAFEDRRERNAELRLGARNRHEPALPSTCWSCSKAWRAPGSCIRSQ